MTDQLTATIQAVAERVRKYRDRGLGEENTKTSLIEPILEALGWNVHDPDEVHKEYKPTTKANPVDYALCILRTPRLLVEAKGLGENLFDQRWVAQVLGYATIAGAPWCVLTDGDDYCIYNATAPVVAKDKLFCKIKVSETAAGESQRVLTLISRQNMVGHGPEDEWKIFYVDKRVRACIGQIFEDVDKGLIRLIRGKVAELKPKEINESIRRFVVRIESPARTEESGQIRKKPKNSGRKPSETWRPWRHVTLPDLLAAGLLRPPVRLFRKYKGKEVEAKLMADGKVEFSGTVHDSCSTAAEYARATVTGRKMSTNGWVFWQFLDETGNKKTLDEARKRHFEMKNKSPGSSSRL